VELRLLRPALGDSGRLVVSQGAAAARLRGVSPVGAQVTVDRHGRAPVVTQIDGGNGHASVRSPEVHVGLGHVSARDRVPVSVAWRDQRGVPRRLQLTLRPGRWTVLLPEAPGA
jgi:enediyne biosynthesis protein E4